MSHDWITLHRLDFDTPMTKEDVLGPDLPGADFTRTCIGFEIDAQGDILAASTSWGMMGVYPDETAARAVFEDPGAAIPALSKTRESWHGLAVPLSHKGTVNWRGPEETDTALRCGKAEGPLMVITSAGYRGVPDPARAHRFARGVRDVLDFYGDLSGNTGRSAFNGGTVDGRGGFTLTHWTDTPAMLAAAYKSGVHKTQMDSHLGDPMFDYSSFSRLALQASKGTWDGAEIAA